MNGNPDTCPKCGNNDDNYINFWGGEWDQEGEMYVLDRTCLKCNADYKIALKPVSKTVVDTLDVK